MARTSGTAGAGASPAPAALSDPVATVLVESGLPHLDRLFEYEVPPAMDADARPGVRVKVRFAGQDLPGYLVQRRDQAEHPGALSPLRAVVSPEAVLTEPILELARDVAATHAGTAADVLRLAIPPRHRRAEQALALEPPTVDPLPMPATGDSVWAHYRAGSAFLHHLGEGRAPAAAWTALPAAGDPTRDWPIALAQAAAATVAGGRGAIVVVPDHRDVDRLEAAVRSALGSGRYVRLTADQGPQARYTAWLKVLRGYVPVVIGTRAAAYAPVRDLGLIALWDDGDDLYQEPRAPYAHSRDVVINRARIQRCALVIGGYGRTVAAESLVQAGVLQPISAARSLVRAHAPRVIVAGQEEERERDPAATSARLPTLAWRTAKSALAHGPVLIQVPRRGYLPALACQDCRARARCPRCHGPLALGESGSWPVCRWCGAQARGWRCPECDGIRLRSLIVGARRTAEELGRAFPGAAIVTSGGAAVLAQVSARPALVIATPGAEPVAEGGYAAALLLDAWALLDRPVLDAAPEALRRWMGAAALVRAPGPDVGTIIVSGVAPGDPVPAVQALVRWDPVWLAGRELVERHLLHLPPVDVFAEVTGPRAVLSAITQRSELPEQVVTFGPTALRGQQRSAGAEGAGGGTGEVDGRSAHRAGNRGRQGHPGRGGQESADGDRPPNYRLLLRAPPQQAHLLAELLRTVRAERSARKEVESVRVEMGIQDVT